MKRSILLFGFLVSCPALPVFSSESDADRLRPAWQALDANQDGSVALDELHPMQAAMLGTTDGLASVDGTLGEHTGQSSDVQCAIDFFGPTDLRDAEALDPSGRPSIVTRLLGGAAAEHPGMAADASPMFHVDADDVPFFIVHGTEDPRSLMRTP